MSRRDSSSIDPILRHFSTPSKTPLDPTWAPINAKFDLVLKHSEFIRPRWPLRLPPLSDFLWTLFTIQFFTSCLRFHFEKKSKQTPACYRRQRRVPFSGPFSKGWGNSRPFSTKVPFRDGKNSRTMNDTRPEQQLFVAAALAASQRSSLIIFFLYMN